MRQSRQRHGKERGSPGVRPASSLATSSSYWLIRLACGAALRRCSRRGRALVFRKPFTARKAAQERFHPRPEADLARASRCRVLARKQGRGEVETCIDSAPG